MYLKSSSTQVTVERVTSVSGGRLGLNETVFGEGVVSPTLTLNGSDGGPDLRGRSTSGSSGRGPYNGTPRRLIRWDGTVVHTSLSY